MTHVLLAAVTAVGMWTWSPAAKGAPVTYRLTDDKALGRDGFTRIQPKQPSTSRFGAGGLRITNVDHWRLPYAKADARTLGGAGRDTAWSSTSDAERGWAIEARIRLDGLTTTCADGGAYIVARTGGIGAALLIRPEGISLGGPKDRSPRAHAAVRTSDVHTYRVEARRSWVRVLVDGQQVIAEGGLDLLLGTEIPILQFGNACAQGTSIWESLAYDVAGAYATMPAVQCTTCRAGEHYLIAHLWQKLDKVLPPAERKQLAKLAVAHTGALDDTEIMYRWLDGFAHLVLPGLLQAEHPGVAARYRTLPSLRTPAGRTAATQLLATPLPTKPEPWPYDSADGHRPQRASKWAAALAGYASVLRSVAASKREVRLRGFDELERVTIGISRTSTRELLAVLRQMTAMK